MVAIPSQGLAKRQSCYVGGVLYDDCPNSYAWDWARWVVLAIIIVLFLLLFIGCSCYSSRRRRRAGLRPYYGTGWAGGQYYPPNQADSRYAHYGPQQPWQPAPPYSPQPPQYYGHNGYFGNRGQHEGIELASPGPVYQSDHEYEPPVGPPPGKKGGDVVR